MGGLPRRKVLRIEASSTVASKRMRACGPRDTAPELALRRMLHGMGLRYRLDEPVLKGFRRKADLVFRRARIAVYVDGCFWHRCPLHATWPKANAEFWRDKIETNRLRDIDTDRRLAEQGWLVIRVWEHEDPAPAAERIAAAIAARRSA